MKKYNRIINGIEYENIIYEDKEFLIQYVRPRRKGKYNNRFRLVNVGGEDTHTHLNNIGVCKKVIKFVREKKLPLTSKKYLIISCHRLSLDKEYKEDLMDLYNRKKRKLSYYNKNLISR